LIQRSSLKTHPWTVYEIEMLGQQVGIKNLESYLGRVEAGIAGEFHDEEWNIGPKIELQIPLFNRGKDSRKLALRQFEALQAKALSHGRDLSLALESARRRFELSDNRLERIQNELLPVVQSIQRDQILNYNAMQIGLFELLESRSLELSNTLMYLEAQKDWWKDRLEIELLLVGKSPQKENGND